MVDAIVSFAVQRLGDFLIQEAVFLRGIEEEVVWLKNELRWMQSFLKDAEEKQDSDERIRAWTSEIRDIAYKAEEVIETFILEAKGTGISKREWLKKCFCISSNTDLYDIGKEIEALRKKLLDISRKREVYGINNIGNTQEGTSGAISTQLRDLRITTSYVDEEHVVGLEDDAQLLETKLFMGEPRRCVISILGMGGQGKTTLARKVYNNNINRFDQHAWVCVSQEWKIRDLLERIIKSFKRLTKDEFEMLEMMKDYDMEQYLRDLLEGCCYLVVIDDVWQKEAWDSLRRAFPYNTNGSRIIITTRIEAVAELSDQRTYVHKIRFLRSDEGWRLFCKKALPDDSGALPPDMEKLGQEMVAKCSGLPLAIIVLGGLLSRKQFHEWHAVKECIWRELKNNLIHISSLLALSFKDLSHELKSCFLYLGLFPEDFEINTEKLVELWVAEEFIVQGEGLYLEEVANNCLKELIGRSLIQVVQRNWRTISKCRVHDLLRDLAVRRLMILIYTRFKLVRVLDLEGVSFSTSEERLRLFEAMGKLIHLRYLGLRNTDMNELPESIAKLQALQFLDVSSTNGPEIILPREISKLKQLRHLRGAFVIPKCTNRRGKLQDPFLLFEELTNLQSLKVVDIHDWPRQEKEDEIALNAFAKLQNLASLSMRFFCDYKLSHQPLLSYKNLIELRLQEYRGNLPKEMHIALPNLKFLELGCCELEQDPMPVLELLPKLTVLLLVQLVIVQEETMTCTATGFPRLEVFQDYRLSNLSKFQVEEGAMPRLRVLTTTCCENENLPERLRSLPGVNDLDWDWEDSLGYLRP